MESLVKEQNAEAAEKSEEGEATLSTIGVMKDGSVRANLIVSVVLILGMQMDGSAGVLGYTNSVFHGAGMDESASQLATAGTGMAVFLSAIISVFIMDTAGRRKIILSEYMMQLSMLIGLQICLAGIEYGGWGRAANWASVGTIYIYVGGYSIKSCVVWVAVAELFPQKARSGAMTINMTLNWTLNWVTMLAFLPWQNVTAPWQFLIFIISMSIVIVVVYFRLPETTGKEMGTGASTTNRVKDVRELEKF